MTLERGAMVPLRDSMMVVPQVRDSRVYWRAVSAARTRRPMKMEVPSGRAFFRGIGRASRRGLCPT